MVLSKKYVLIGGAAVVGLFIVLMAVLMSGKPGKQVVEVAGTVAAEACPQCPACPEQVPCPECETCPTPPPPVDAVASVVLVTSNRQGPQNFMSMLFVHTKGGAWNKVFSAKTEGPDATYEQVTADWIGYAMYRRLSQNPGVVTGNAAVDDASGMVCQQNKRQLNCWVLADGEERGTSYFMMNSVRLLEQPGG